MGRLRAKCDYENIRNARIEDNKARMASFGFNFSDGEVVTVVSSPKIISRDKKPKSKSAVPVRRSDRLKGMSSDHLNASPTQMFVSASSAEKERVLDPVPDICEDKIVEEHQAFVSPTKSSRRKLDVSTPPRRSERLKGKPVDSPVSSETSVEISSICEDVLDPKVEDEEISDPAPKVPDYESIRIARILENKARMESLGLHRKVGELQAFASPTKSSRKWEKRKSDLSTPRRSERLKGNPGCSAASSPIVTSEKVYQSVIAKRVCFSERCGSKARGSVYDPVFGICCHFCRQKKLCGEEDCKRCGDRDINQPCIGKTECLVCHSSTGVMCRACLKIRYGEELEEVRKNKDWMCPHCIEEKGIKPYWICNSSLCLKKRKLAPTGIAIYRAREEGYKSVAHQMMDKLKCEAGQQ